MDEMRAMLDELMGQDRDGQGPKCDYDFLVVMICSYVYIFDTFWHLFQVHGLVVSQRLWL
jgi:hypothetical protein